jgi:hypothetical protein
MIIVYFGFMIAASSRLRAHVALLVVIGVLTVFAIERHGDGHQRVPPLFVTTLLSHDTKPLSPEVAAQLA